MTCSNVSVRSVDEGDEGTGGDEEGDNCGGFGNGFGGKDGEVVEMETDLGLGGMDGGDGLGGCVVMLDGCEVAAGCEVVLVCGNECVENG